MNTLVKQCHSNISGSSSSTADTTGSSQHVVGAFIDEMVDYVDVLPRVEDLRRVGERHHARSAAFAQDVRCDEGCCEGCDVLLPLHRYHGCGVLDHQVLREANGLFNGDVASMATLLVLMNILHGCNKAIQPSKPNQSAA